MVGKEGEGVGVFCVECRLCYMDWITCGKGKDKGNWVLTADCVRWTG